MDRMLDTTGTIIRIEIGLSVADVTGCCGNIDKVSCESEIGWLLFGCRD